MMTPCTSEDDFRQCCVDSEREPVVLMKHSTSCPISAAARRACVQFAEQQPEAKCREVLVIEQRPLSRWIAGETGVRHASPQVIIFVERESDLAGVALGYHPGRRYTRPMPAVCRPIADRLPDISRACVRTTSSGKAGAGRLFRPLDGFQVIAHELLVEAVLRAARRYCSASQKREESGVSTSSARMQVIPRRLEAEFEFRVGDDDAAHARVIGGGGIELEARLASCCATRSPTMLGGLREA